jgi:preprotein translocase subunit SecE
VFGRFNNFLKEMRAEFTKISWSSREELTGSTMVVIVSTILLAVVIGIWDFAMARIISLVLK